VRGADRLILFLRSLRTDRFGLVFLSYETHLEVIFLRGSGDLLIGGRAIERGGVDGG
jgi:hypothetical protein